MNRICFKMIVKVLICFFYLSVNAQNKGGLFAFYIEKDGKMLYGFKDGNDGIVIEPTYYWADDFHEGLAVVQDIETEKFGYINEKNEIVIPLIYDEACSFGMGRDENEGFNNLAMVNIGNTKERRFMLFTRGKWGLINKKGEAILPIEYGFIYPLSYGVAFVLDGEFVSHMKDVNSYDVEIKGKYGIIDSNGKIVVSPIYDKADLTFFDNGVATVEKEGEKFRINTKGEIVN